MARTETKKAERKAGQKPGKHLLAFAAVIVLCLFVVYIRAVKQNKKPEEVQQTKKALSVFEMEKRDKEGKLPSQQTQIPSERPSIKTIKLSPEQPTILDTVKAELTADYSGEGTITYEYQWRINNKAVTAAKGDTLSSELFKKGDLISVRATPFADGIEGPSHVSAFLVIQSAPHSLELKEMTQKLSDTIELQLTSKDPDNDKITFALEEPILEGMTIEKESGRIAWKPQKKEKGVYSFKASAIDADGVKVIKTFELKLGPS